MTSGKFLPLLVLGGSLLVQGHKSRPPPALSQHHI